MLSLDNVLHQNLKPVSLLVFIPLIFLGCLMLYTSFGKVHPVYFDENCFYWNKNGQEQIIPFSSIACFGIVSGASSHGTIKYYYESNKIKSIRFYLAQSYWPGQESMLKEIQRLVQIEKPEFKIILKGFFRNRELKS